MRSSQAWVQHGSGLVLLLAVLLLSSAGQQQHCAQARELTAQPKAVRATGTRSANRNADLPQLIPLQLLLGESKYKNPQLSTDGKYLAYIRPAPKSGVANVFVRRLPDVAAPAAAGATASNNINNSKSMFEREGTDKDRQVTFDDGKGVSAYSWSEDSSSIFYIQDQDGDENFHLYSVPISGGAAAVDLTPFPGVKAQGIVSNELFPNKLYIGLNRRDPEVFDMYSLDVNTYKLTLDTINPGHVSNWLMDYEFNIRGAECYNNTDGSSYVIINDALPKVTNASATAAARAARLASTSRAKKTRPGVADVKGLETMFAKASTGKWSQQEWIDASSSRSDVSKWRRLITWPFGEEGGVFKFNKAGDGLYIISSIGRDTTEFQLISTAPGAKVIKRIASNPLANVGPVEFHPHSWQPQLVSFNYLKVQWTLLDKAIKSDWDKIAAFRPDEEVSIVDRSSDEKVWLLGYSGDSFNSKYYLYHPGTWPPQLLFDTQPAVLKYTTSKMHPVVITARDGLQLPSYLSLPVQRSIPEVLPECVTGQLPDLTGQGAPSRKVASANATTCPLNLSLPLVLAVHGGPWSRDTWGSDAVVQFLANRGYAVLQVNYRASSGYGKRFMNLGNGQWGIGNMQHDLTDAVKWAVAKGIADPKRVCIMGGSYGGYATLAGLAFTPELYACGADLVGISNVGTFMKSIPPYWKPLRYEWLTRVGDAESNNTFNRMISPLFHVDNIRAPLFIAQGANDPRVPQAESDQMFKAMKEKGLDVQYVLYPDEGHGLSRADNRMDYYGRVEQFFAKYLRGRAGKQLALPSASAKVIATLQDLETNKAAAAKGKMVVPAQGEALKASSQPSKPG